ncbi:unnamed protein product [Callosobruchus maculatus]|uniref:Uncharacterized protein n=1 Tax=Callosobruchus maculatus TaxID=64391 RepID=A0A653C1D8_CALMS|nr:unnamed protein product [Callosobruchus maculatus]
MDISSYKDKLLNLLSDTTTYRKEKFDPTHKAQISEPLSISTSTDIPKICILMVGQVPSSSCVPSSGSLKRSTSGSPIQTKGNFTKRCRLNLDKPLQYGENISKRYSFELGGMIKITNVEYGSSKPNRAPNLKYRFEPFKKPSFRSAVAVEQAVVLISPLDNNDVLTAVNFFYENPGRFSCSACDWLQLLNHEEECGRHSQGSTDDTDLLVRCVFVPDGSLRLFFKGVPFTVELDLSLSDTARTTVVLHFLCSDPGGTIRLASIFLQRESVQQQMAMTEMRFCNFIVWSTEGTFVEILSFNEAFWLYHREKALFHQKGSFQSYWVQQQMAMTEMRFCNFIVWSTEGTFVEILSFNEAFWLYHREKALFHQKGIIPELLGRLFTQSTPSITTWYMVLL